VTEPGLGVLAADLPDGLKGARVGLVAHAASRLPDGRHAVEVLRAHPDLTLVRLFGPEHGFFGAAQEGEGVEDGVDPRLGLEVVSLYGSRHAPSREHLDDLDALLFDLQDVGVRAYTYLSTLKACLERCAEVGVPLALLDRPNPLGRGSFGPGVEEGYGSFVGAHDVRFVHGMTLGELSLLIARDLGVAAPHVVKMRGYAGEPWAATGLPWVPPSPNLPTLTSARLYPATVFVEGTNLSEGRGTDAPFLQVGAPWLDGGRLADALNARALGVRFSPTGFVPTRSKHQGARVEGVRVERIDPDSFNPLQVAFALLHETKTQRPEAFSWVGSGERPFVDLLFGSDVLRRAVDGELDEGAYEAHVSGGEGKGAKRVRLY